MDKIILESGIAAKLDQDSSVVTQYPIVNVENLCGNRPISKLNSFKDILMSVTYSTNCVRTDKFFSDLLSIYTKRSSYIDDVINLLILDIANGKEFNAVSHIRHYSLGNGIVLKVQRTEPLRIIHCQDREEFMINDGEKIAGGKFNFHYNVITFEDISSFGAFIHEAAHAVLSILYQNGGKPFAKSDLASKEYYDLSKMEVFLNVAKKLGVKDKVFNDINDVLDILKTDSILDIIYVLSRDLKGIPDYLLWQIEGKYFDGERIVHSDGFKNLLKIKLQLISSKLKLSFEDLRILECFSLLLYAYSGDELDIELIVRIPELLARGVSEEAVAEYFLPLMEYWGSGVDLIL